MEEDIDRRFKHVEDDCSELKDNDKGHSKSLVDIEKSNIRMEGTVDKVLEATKILTTNLAKVTTEVKEINERPLQTYNKLKNAIIAGTVTLAFFALTNLWTFYYSMVLKGLIK